MGIVKEPTAINQILTANKKLTKLVKKSSSLENLNQLFQKILDNDLSKHCQIAQKSSNTLTIIVDNAAWATNLRYSIPDLIKLLRTQPEFKSIRDIRYHVQRHSEIPTPPPPPPKNPLAIQNARKLKELAGQFKQPVILLDSASIKKYVHQSIDIEVVKTVSSTNDHLKAKSTAPHIVIAEQQTAGKGRLGRTWYSPFGLNIYLSYSWLFNKAVNELDGLSIMVGESIIKALASDTTDLKIKDPNDILYNNKKLAGILIETINQSPTATQAIIGIGLNVNMPHPPDPNWTSLINILGAPQDRNQIAGLLIEQLNQVMVHFSPSE